MIMRIIDEIDECLEHDMYLAALTIAVTLPDACAKIEYPTIEGNKKRYTTWVYEKMDKYDIPKIDNYNEESPEFIHFDANLLYDLRCRLLHEGRPDFKHKLVTDVKLFYEKSMNAGSTGLTYDNSTPQNITRSIVVNVYDLIRKICMCAEVSYEKYKEEYDADEVVIHYSYPGMDGGEPIHE